MPARRVTRIFVPALSDATLLLAGCSQTEQSRTPETVPAVTFDDALTHVHGLHVTADGAVLAGTHTGLYSLGLSGVTSRVGDSDDDLMGLTGARRRRSLLHRASRRIEQCPQSAGATGHLKTGRVGAIEALTVVHYNTAYSASNQALYTLR